MGKNIKSYATTQVHSPLGRKGSLTANNPNLSATNVIQLNRTHSYNPNLSATNVIQLNRTHSFKFTTKFFISVLYFGKIQAN